jgi:hypothetical protein
MITIREVRTVRDNYHVALVMPNGEIFTVMIPLKYDSLPDKDVPFGLNLFSTGHYKAHNL